MSDSIETVRFDRAYPAFACRSAGCAEAGGRRRLRGSRRRQFGRIHIRGMSRPVMALAPLGTHHIRRGWSDYLTRPSLMGTDVPVGPVRMMHVMRHRFPFDLSPVRHVSVDTHRLRKTAAHQLELEPGPFRIRFRLPGAMQTPPELNIARRCRDSRRRFWQSRQGRVACMTVGMGQNPGGCVSAINPDRVSDSHPRPAVPITTH